MIPGADLSSLAIRRLDPADWPGFAAGFADLGHEQSGAYAGPAAARIGAEAAFYAIERAGRPAGAAALRIKRVPGLGRGIAWAPGAPLCQVAGAGPSPEERAALLACLCGEIAGRQGHILRLRPPALPPAEGEGWERAARAAGFGPAPRARGYRSIALDLSLAPEALEKGLDKKWRQELKAGRRAGLAVERGTADRDGLGARFRRLYDRVRAAKGFESDLSPEFFYALDGADFRHEVLIATLGGEDAAGIVTGTAGGTVTYLFGATDTPGRGARAGYVLIWEALMAARAEGLAWFDMGGIDPEGNPGVHRFKKRMGGVEIAAPGPFEHRPPGPLPRLVAGLEGLRARMKGRP